MKKISIYPYDPFSIDTGITVLESKNSTLIWRLSRFLNDEADDVAVLSENDKILKVNKAIRYIGDVTIVPDFNKTFGKQVAEV